MSIEEKFKRFKEGFIINNFADNIYFNRIVNPAKVRKSEPYAPKLNVWTSQPIESIKTMKHL